LKQNWYEKWFSNEYYIKLYSHRDDNEARDLINLIQRNIPLPTNSKVLDVCCGAGRHSIELAKRGYDVTGFDLSKYLISQAKKSLSSSNERNLKVKFIVKDMLKFDFENKFDIAINVFSSFGYFENDKSNFSVFTNIKNSLKPNGYFVFDFLNGDFLRKNLVPYSEDYHDGLKVTQKRKIENNFVYKDIFIGKEKYLERIRLYSLNDIKKALINLGFNIVDIFGDYLGGKFEKENSKRMILISKLNAEK